jgi:hypothetical protein
LRSVSLRYFEATELMDHGSQNFYLRMQTFDNPDYSYAQYLSYVFVSYVQVSRLQLIILSQRPSDLRNTVGYRYVIHEPSSRPPLWIIHKQLKRSAGEREELVGVYYILHEMIWQASALGDIVQSRLVSLIRTIRTATATDCRTHRSMPPVSSRPRCHG